jgi:hypothetical protein
MDPKPVRIMPRMAGLRIHAALSLMILIASAHTTGPVRAQTVDPYEPNDSWNQATSLQNGVQLEAWIAPDGDRDWYTFQVARSGHLDIRIESLPADFDLYLAWRNPETQQLDGIPYQNHSGTMPEYLSGYVQTTGTYYLRVYAAEGVFDDADSYLLTTSWPGALPPAENTLTAGVARGAAGTQATVALALANDSAVKALQVDLRFDPEVGIFQGAQAAGRASEMTFDAAPQADDVVRIVLYCDGNEHLAAGEGAVAHLTFALVGAAGSQCEVELPEVLLSNLDAQALPVTVAAGGLEVIDGAQAPHVRVFTLANPGRPRTLQIFAAADQALTAPPVVTASGMDITMAGVDGAENLYLGTFHAAEDADSVSIHATCTNGTASGVAQTTIVF